MSMLEAECTRCKEIFVPHGVEPDELIHGETEKGEPCGGIGIIQGQWFAPGESLENMLHTKMIKFWVAEMEDHGRTMPNCQDRKCEFHHPELFGDTPFHQADYHSDSC